MSELKEIRMKRSMGDVNLNFSFELFIWVRSPQMWFVMHVFICNAFNYMIWYTMVRIINIIQYVFDYTLKNM